MNEQEKKLILELLSDTIESATTLVFESIAMLFEEMAKHPELNLQQVLIAMSIALKSLIKEKKNETH